MRKIIMSSILLLCFVFVFFASFSAAQEKFPSQPIRLILTHEAGGSSDIFNRIFQPYLSKALGVPVVIENMTGAGGNKARAFVYKQVPDGYQILVSKQPSMSGGEILNNGNFETLKFVHVYNVAGNNYNCLAVPYDSSLKTLEDVKKASQKESIITSGTGVGTNAYLNYARYKQLGFNLTYVPFSGGAGAAMAVAGGKTQAGLGNIIGMYPMHEQKKVRILAIHGPQRSPLYPELPTAAEQGYPEIALDEFVGYFAPPGLSKERLNILEKAFAEAAANKEFQKLANQAGYGTRPLGSKEFFKESKEMHELILSVKNMITEDEKKEKKTKKEKK